MKYTEAVGYFERVVFNAEINLSRVKQMGIPDEWTENISKKISYCKMAIDAMKGRVSFEPVRVGDLLFEVTNKSIVEHTVESIQIRKSEDGDHTYIDIWVSSPGESRLTLVTDYEIGSVMFNEREEAEKVFNEQAAIRKRNEERIKNE